MLSFACINLVRILRIQVCHKQIGCGLSSPFTANSHEGQQITFRGPGWVLIIAKRACLCFRGDSVLGKCNWVSATLIHNINVPICPNIGNQPRLAFQEGQQRTLWHLYILGQTGCQDQSAEYKVDYFFHSCDLNASNAASRTGSASGRISSQPASTCTFGWTPLFPISSPFGKTNEVVSTKMRDPSGR